jgi:CheY-like chemotaxis protein
MVEWENDANIPNVRFISIPVQSLSIANVLNGKADTRGYFSSQSSGLIRYTYPGARLLVVDDIATNLKVAEGLLAPYNAKIDTALSGARAIEMVKQQKYDIVFMDHMMPEMDGIEATAAIRAWEVEQEKQGIDRSAVPIIALTANAVSGMREMFIEKGFNDFLAKPIDVSKLDEILARWIPKEKREKKGTGNGDRYSNDKPQSLPPISGVDIQKGISMTGGTMALYRQVTDLFCKDAQERLPFLQNMPEAAALSAFVTQVHALKSASASIGAAELSDQAAALEAAGKAADLDFIREHLPGFAQALAQLIGGIQTWESAVKKEDTSNGEHDHETVTKLFNELAAALETENAGDIDRIIDELSAQALDAETKEALEKISDNVLMTEFNSAAEIVRSLLERQV